MHELAMGADHLFGRQRDLLDWPTILVDGFHGGGFQCEGRGQQPGCRVSWVVDGIHAEGLGLGAGDHAGQDQLFPDLGAYGNTVFGPAFYPIWCACGDGLAFVTAFQWTDPLAIDRFAAFASLC